jgi:hypothetical protein
MGSAQEREIYVRIGDHYPDIDFEAGPGRFSASE